MTVSTTRNAPANSAAGRLDVDLRPLDEVLGSLQRAAERVPIEGMPDGELGALLKAVRLARQTLDSLVVRIGMRADELVEADRVDSARALLLGDGQVSGRTARNEAARAEIIRRLPDARAAVVAGAIGGDQLDSLARRAGRLADDQLAMLDTPKLLADAINLPADTFDAALRRAIEAAADDLGLTDALEKRNASEFRHWFDRRTGMGKFSGRLDPERYEALTNAVDQHTAALATSSRGETPKDANLAAAALVELVTSAGRRGSRLPHITVVVDEQTLRSGSHGRSIRQTGGGHELSEQSIARLCCDSILQRVVLSGDSVPIDVGRTQRTATPAQWTAVRSIHSSCGWTDCDRPLAHCQLHHIREWERGGPTDISNLVPLCSEHHHRVHEGRWRIELGADRAHVVRRPDGRVYATGGPPSRRPPIAGQRYLKTE